MLITVRDLLKVKGDDLWYVTPDTTVFDALQTLAEKDIGALLVLDGEQIAGIISERDIVRKIGVHETYSLDTPVSHFMTKDVFTINPKKTIEDCMGMMTEHRIRHLPVVEKDKLAGLVSIGDVVKANITSREFTIEQLQKYITGDGYSR